MFSSSPVLDDDLWLISQFLLVSVLPPTGRHLWSVFVSVSVRRKYTTGLWRAVVRAVCVLERFSADVVYSEVVYLTRRGFESLQEGRENFLLQGQFSVLTLISVSVAPPCYRSST